MGRMISPAGEVEFAVAGLSHEGNSLTITGQMGIWDATIYMEPKEVLYMARLMISPKFLRYLITLPFVLFTLFYQGKNKTKT